SSTRTDHQRCKIWRTLQPKRTSVGSMVVATEWIACTPLRMAGDRRSPRSSSKPVRVWGNHHSRTYFLLALWSRLTLFCSRRNQMPVGNSRRVGQPQPAEYRGENSIGLGINHLGRLMRSAHRFTAAHPGNQPNGEASASLTRNVARSTALFSHGGCAHA